MHLEGVTKERSYTTDAISANRNLYATHFETQVSAEFSWKFPRRLFHSFFVPFVLSRFDSTFIDLNGKQVQRVI